MDFNLFFSLSLSSATGSHRDRGLSRVRGLNMRIGQMERKKRKKLNKSNTNQCQAAVPGLRVSNTFAYVPRPVQAGNSSNKLATGVVVLSPPKSHFNSQSDKIRFGLDLHGAEGAIQNSPRLYLSLSFCSSMFSLSLSLTCSLSLSLSLLLLNVLLVL